MKRNEKIVVTKKMIKSVYDEIERRLYMDWVDGMFEDDHEKGEAFRQMLQGAYGALMVVSSNWDQTANWIREFEREYVLENF